MSKKLAIAMFGQKRLSRERLQDACDHPEMVMKIIRPNGRDEGS